MPKWTTLLFQTVVFSHPAIGTVGLTEEEAIKRVRPRKTLKSILQKFASMYSAVTSHRQEARFKLVTAGADEKVVGLMVSAMVSMK